ncbi:ATP-binding protein [Streptomyces sp. ODS28]|uniref:ATP-binding protein n=1 Tax=Streptomyces sp. ODS28 TaxID=3136688 RepID=UPI0031E9F16C
MTTGFLTSDRTPDAGAGCAEAAALIVSELVTNAVCHTDSRCRLRLTFGGNGVTVEVDDTSPHRPHQPGPSSERESGRGMLLVHALAHRLHTTRHPHGGKTVCAILALP